MLFGGINHQGWEVPNPTQCGIWEQGWGPNASPVTLSDNGQSHS